MDSELKKKSIAMREGGKRLARVRDALEKFTKIGMSFAEIEAEAQRLIKKEGAIPNFALVPGYSWATCIMKNDEVCHGIPTKEKIVNDGDLITIDVGLLYQGYNLDTTTSFFRGTVSPEKEKFLEIGKKALYRSIDEAVLGNSIYDISYIMQKIPEKAGYGSVYQLTGHAIGKKLHEDPMVPCIAYRSDKKKKLYEGQTLAIEIMYTMGSPFLVLDKDGWTYRTADHSLAGMIEETVLITKDGPEILTKA
jgi:methionyl aminopeptidase